MPLGPGFDTLAARLNRTTNLGLAQGQLGANVLQRGATGGMDNPYSNRISGAANAQGNPYASGILATGGTANPYRAGFNEFAMGGPSDPVYGRVLAGARGDYLSPESNPYLKATFGQAAKEVTDAYSRGTAAQTDAAAAQAGAFGSSGYGEQTALNQFGLGQNLNNLATDIYGGAYSDERGRQLQSQQMASQIHQARQGERLQAMGMGADLASQDLARRLQAQGMGADMHMAEQQRQLQAMGLGAGVEQQDIANRLGAAQMMPGYMQQMQDLQRAPFDINQQYRDYGQQQLDLNYANWREHRDYPYQQLDALGSFLANAVGKGSQSSITQPYFQARSNPWAGALGGALAGYGATGGYGGAGLGALFGGMAGA